MQQLLSYRLSGVCVIRLLPLTVEFATSKVVPLTAAERKQLNFKLSQNDICFLLSMFFY